MGVLWLLSPAAVMAAVAVVGTLAVLLIAWALVHREPSEYRQMDRAHLAWCRQWMAAQHPVSQPPPGKHSRPAGPPT